MKAALDETTQAPISNRFRDARQRTLNLCSNFTPEDMMVQSCPEASPAKWHLAHTAWFFESFILREFLRGYKPFNTDFHWLFNSYYETFSIFPEKRLRSSFSRPSLDEIMRYREHVALGIEKLLDSGPEPEAMRRIELGVNHEEQHQELLLTDILHAFFSNPTHPVFRGAAEESTQTNTQSLHPLRFHPHQGGLLEVGSHADVFCFDNERPRHKVWLEPFSIADRLVTCGEFAEFIADGGYQRPELWLSAGWTAVKTNGWNAPLYWSNEDGVWSVFTLRGKISLTDVQHVPVSQVSFFEADAYARWAGKRLPTEFEWEAIAEGEPVKGNLLDSEVLMPAVSTAVGESPAQLYGDCWEWTASAYLGYPGFRPLEGTLGEYNGKFMSGQMVLRGGSCVTPAAHIRATYRNFFAPDTRWQFSGIRLAHQ